MVERISKFRMTLARDLGEALKQRLRFAHDQLGDHLVMQLAKQVAIAGEIAAIEKGNGELGIVGVVAVAFGERARGGTQLQTQVPQLLRKAANWVFVELLRFAVAKKKEQIDVGVGEKPAAAEAACGHEGEVGRFVVVRGNDVSPEASENVFDEAGALRDGGAAVAGGFEFTLNACRFVVD